MSGALRFFVLVTAVSVCCGTVCSGQAQSGLPPDADSRSSLVEQDCGRKIYHDEYRNPEREYQVHLPKQVTAIACSDSGFQIYLIHPDSGGSEAKPGFSWSSIWVAGCSEPTNMTLLDIADQWAQYQKDDSERAYATDLQIDQPVQSSLSSLQAIKLRATRTEPKQGGLIYEVVVAKNPDNKAYVIEMVSLTSTYEKNHKLFQAVVEGFTYVPRNTRGEQ
jgi:hypothetical protein